MASDGSSKKSRWWVLPGLVLFTFVFSLVIGTTQPILQLEKKITDKLFELRGPIPIEDTTVVLISISQEAEEEIPEKYPWPTHYYAKLIKNLNKAGAKAIGVDVILDKRDNYSPLNDTLFAEALREYENVVLAGKISGIDQARGGGSQSRQLSLVTPHLMLQESNPNRMGLVKAVKNIDNVVRKYLLFENFQDDTTFYSLGIEVLKLYEELSYDQISNGEEYFTLGPHKIPKFNEQLMTINYYNRPRKTFPIHSFESVIDDSTVLLQSEDPEFQTNTFSDPYFGLVNSDAFKDKIVLVGAFMPELQDYHATPFAPDGSMAGVEMHAHAIQTILNGNYLYTWPDSLYTLIFFVLSFFIVLATRKLGGLWGFMVFLVLATLVVAGVIYGFLEYSYIIEATGFLLTLSLGYMSTLSYEYVTEQREKRRIRSMFSSYVSPAVVNEMIESGKEPQLGGDEEYITAFFSDIQSFSSFSEKLEAKDLVKLINEYLSAMTDILTEHDGTLDKYIGDAIVAFFGAPIPKEDHAYRACIVSQLMQQKLGELRDKWRDEGERWPEIVHHMRNRIGINTGRMVTGNMGSNRRFNYTMMGDNVNLAARCESGAKSFGVFTMVTEETKQEAEKHGDRCVFRYLDCIVVKGRSKPVNVYEIMGLKEQLSEEDFRCRELFEMGIDSYKNQDWEEARRYFKLSSELEVFQPEDDAYIHTNPSLVYLDRCDVMAENPPGEDWDGVYVMETK